MSWPRGRRPAVILRTAFLFLFVLFLVYVTFFARWRPHSLEDVQRDLMAFGVWAPLAAVLLQALGTVMLVPGFLLVIATALLFGLDSIWISLLGQTLGAVLAYLIARHVGREPLRALLGQRLLALERALERHGFRTLLILRLISLLPSPVIVYAPGLVNIRLSHVTLAAALGLLPFVVVFGLFGHSLARVGHPRDLLDPVFVLPVLLLVGLVSLPLLVIGGVRRFRRRQEFGSATAGAPSHHKAQKGGGL